MYLYTHKAPGIVQTLLCSNNKVISNQIPNIKLPSQKKTPSYFTTNMDSLKEKVTSTVTGDAHKKPALTKDGAYTTQDADNAHTIEGTSADPNSTGSKIGDKAQEAEEKTKEAT